MKTKIELGKSVNKLVNKSVNNSIRTSLMFTTIGSVDKSVWISVITPVYSSIRI
jgi:uncharacterized membrane protein YjdF